MYVQNFYELSEGQKAFQTGTNLLTTTTTNPQPGYIVEGTGETGQLETTNNALSLGDEYAVTTQPEIVGETDPATGNPYILEQTFLQNRGSSTVTDQDQLYTHFPGSTSGFGPDTTGRNPIVYFNNNLNN